MRGAKDLETVTSIENVMFLYRPLLRGRQKYLEWSKMLRLRSEHAKLFTSRILEVWSGKCDPLSRKRQSTTCMTFFSRLMRETSNLCHLWSTKLYFIRSETRVAKMVNTVLTKGVKYEEKSRWPANTLFNLLAENNARALNRARTPHSEIILYYSIILGVLLLFHRNRKLI